jgi:hypothetical protein
MLECTNDIVVCLSACVHQPPSVLSMSVSVSGLIQPFNLHNRIHAAADTATTARDERDGVS